MKYSLELAKGYYIQRVCKLEGRTHKFSQIENCPSSSKPAFRKRTNQEGEGMKHKTTNKYKDKFPKFKVSCAKGKL